MVRLDACVSDYIKAENCILSTDDTLLVDCLLLYNLLFPMHLLRMAFAIVSITA